MIIDADVHMTPYRTRGVGMQAEELIERMDNSGVDAALTWVQLPYVRTELDVVQKNLYEKSKLYPKRFYPIGWADPTLGVDVAIDTVKRCVEEYGFYGVKLNGKQNDFRIDDPKISMPVVEAIAKTGKVMAFHIGADGYDKTHPYKLMKIAKLYPESKILMVHMGGVAFDDLSKEAIEVAQECPNVTLVGSGVRIPSILNAVQTLGAHRVCFGSDTPFELMWVCIAQYEALFKKILTPEEFDMIMYKNIANVLGIQV